MAASAAPTPSGSRSMHDSTAPTPRGDPLERRVVVGERRRWVLEERDVNTVSRQGVACRPSTNKPKRDHTHPHLPPMGQASQGTSHGPRSCTTSLTVAGSLPASTSGSTSSTRSKGAKAAAIPFGFRCSVGKQVAATGHTYQTACPLAHTHPRGGVRCGAFMHEGLVAHGLLAIHHRGKPEVHGADRRRDRL